MTKPFRIETVRGKPYRVGGRTLTPMARITSLGRGRGTVGRRQIQGWGTGFGRVVPVAMIEEVDGVERRVPIVDATAAVLRGVFMAALALTLFFTLLRHRIRGSRRAVQVGRAATHKQQMTGL